MYCLMVHRVNWIDINTENTLICSLLIPQEFTYFRPPLIPFHIRSIIWDACWQCILVWGFQFPVSQISCMHAVYIAHIAKISMMGLNYHSVDHCLQKARVITLPTWHCSIQNGSIFNVFYHCLFKFCHGKGLPTFNFFVVSYIKHLLKLNSDWFRNIRS